MSYWIKSKTQTTDKKIYFKYKETNRLKVKGWKKICPAKTSPNKIGVTMLISEKVDLRANSITKDNEGDLIMIKTSINQEDIPILNIYEPNNRASKYVKQLIETLKRNK